MPSKDQDRSQTLSEFCDAENFSLPYYFKLRRLGLGPEELRINGLIRIVPEARVEWRERMRELQGTREAKLENGRRRAQAVEAAKRSVESRQRAKGHRAEPKPTRRSPR